MSRVTPRKLYLPSRSLRVRYDRCHGHLAVPPVPAHWTHTLVVIYAVDARRITEARLRTTLVNIYRAIASDETPRTVALKVIDEIPASTTIGARIPHAVVHIRLTQLTHVAGDTAAVEAISEGDALAPEQAGFVGAVVEVILTVLPAVPRGTRAPVPRYVVYTPAPCMSTETIYLAFIATAFALFIMLI